MEDLEALTSFRQFLAAVARVRPSSSGSRERLAAFRLFLTSAARLRLPSPTNVEQLKTFLGVARPLAAGPARRQWRALQPYLGPLRHWLIDCDLLDRILALEDSYTELISWALCPATHPNSAKLRQQTWLTSLGIDWRNAAPAEPRSQVLTEDGVPDLVLSFGDFTVVVEVKTESDEHLVPSGRPQTVAYPEAVRETLGVGPQHQVHMVFLTPDSRPAGNPEAICTSFAQFAAVLAKALEGVALGDFLRFAFALVITQVATGFSPSIKEIAAWEEEPTHELLIHRIEPISLIARQVLGGRSV